MYCLRALGLLSFRVMKDARNYQIMVLFSMFCYGFFWLKFDLNISWIVGMWVTALGTQYLATKAWRLEKFEWKSAMISGLSLSILMRCPSLSISLALASFAVLSKFLFRVNGKHIFNPTNIALAVGILGTGQVAVNPGQWGNGAVLAFFILCMGIFVASKACRADVSFAFLGTFAFTLSAYSMWAGLPLVEVFAKLRMGSLLIFTFFMISDPRTTPNAQVARLLFGAIVALLGIFLQIGHGVTSGLIVSLAVLSPFTPLLDRLFAGEKFEWLHKPELQTRSQSQPSFS